jgi:hypothetical protein
MRLLVIALAACAPAAADHPDRCEGIFATLSTIPAGAEGPKASAIVGDRGWLAASDDEPITAIGGKVPIEVNFDDSMFVVRCDKKPAYAMYGRISNKTVTTFRAFLDSKERLVEYALVYPDGRIIRRKK